MLDCTAKVNDGRAVGAFTARHQIAALHYPDDHHSVGNFVVARRVSWADRPWQESSWSVDHAAAAGSAVEPGEADVYVSMNSFWGHRRRISSVKNIGAAFVDVDYRKRVRWEDSAPEAVFWSAMRVLDERNMPAPSYAVSTGNGLCLVWLHSWLPAQALPRWNAVQSHLAEALADFGADRKALDAARVFRIIGSKNARAKDWRNEIVRPVYVRGDPERLRQDAYDFDDLADEILPLRRAELRSLQAERARRRAELDATALPRPATYLTSATYYEAVLTDLHRLRRYRHAGGVLPSGARDEWLFLAACAMAHTAPPDVVAREIASLAIELGGWRDTEARSRMSAVLRRAKAAAAGEQWPGPGGQPADPRYRFKATTIVGRLEVTADEMREAQLRVLVDPDRRRELKTIRTRESRHRRGATPRAKVQAERLSLGRRALLLHSKGNTLADIAAIEGVSIAHVSKAMKAARKK
ncbi:MAG: hypothetical protein JWR51_3855 [Devosia sp.]|uniref:hypothetical protein n=1 Tax=Devosia sp. TaxID=1871048 RepID=UPI002606B690|nr:hypothetical protein [Devosia sp.]MDB5530752.1 hypothetical protein [Devosia sp.]